MVIELQFPENTPSSCLTLLNTSVEATQTSCYSIIMIHGLGVVNTRTLPRFLYVRHRRTFCVTNGTEVPRCSFINAVNEVSPKDCRRLLDLGHILEARMGNGSALIQAHLTLCRLARCDMGIRTASSFLHRAIRDIYVVELKGYDSGIEVLQHVVCVNAGTGFIYDCYHKWTVNFTMENLFAFIGRCDNQEVVNVRELVVQEIYSGRKDTRWMKRVQKNTEDKQKKRRDVELRNFYLGFATNK